MHRLLLLAALAVAPLAPAQAFFHGGGGGFGGGGFGGDRGGFGGGGFARPDAGSFARPDSGGFARPEGGTADRPTDYGGYNRTAPDSNNTVNVNRTTNVNGAAPNGAYYHQPTTVNNYSTGCYNCGGGGWGAAAAGVTGLAVGTAVGAAAANNAYRPPVYAPGYVAAPAPAYGGLPPGCAWNSYAGKYACPGGAFFTAAYGANGVYYVPSGP